MEDNIQSYNIYKKELGSIYDLIASIRIRSKCNWYEHGEKSIKLFQNVEKKRSNQITFLNLYLTKKK